MAGFLSPNIYKDLPGSSTEASFVYRRSVDLNISFAETYSKIIINEFQESEWSLIHQESEIINKTFFAQFFDLKKPNEVDLVRLASILEHGANVNFSDKEGRTVLHEVARNWHVDLASFLVDRGADVNYSDNFGRTPLHVAAAANNVEMIAFLIRKGAKVDAVSDGDLLTPVHCAVKHDAFEALVCLYDHHANIHKRDFKQRTPLFLAAEHGYSDLAMMLLKMGSSATVEDDSGFSCLMEMIITMPTVAKYALDQLHVIDETGKEEHYYLKYLTTTSDIGEMWWKDNKTIFCKTLLEVVLINKCFAVVGHPVLKKLIDLKWKNYGLKANQLLIIMDFIFIISWTILMMFHKWEINYNSPKNWWLTLLSIFCIGEMLFVIFVEIRAFLILWNTVRKWKKWRKDQILREEVHCHSCWPQEEINLKRKIVAVDLIKDYYFLDWWHAHDCIVLTFLFTVVCTHVIALGLTGNIKMLCQHLIALSFIPLWLKNMKHLRAFRVIGPFIVTITRMMTDVAKFLFLYFEFFFAFAYSIWLMLGGTSELRTLDEALFFIFRISVQDQWQLGDTADEDRVLAYIIIGTYISIMSFLCFSMFTALFSNTYMRIHENPNVDVLMQRVSIILQAEKRWCIFPHQDKCRDFILEDCAPLKVRYKKKEKHWNENVFPLRETKADKEARLSELALKIKEMLRDCTSIATGIPNKNEEESRTNLQSRQQSKNKKLVVLQKDLWRLQRGLEVLQSQQEILDKELQEVMDKLLEKAQRMCEVYRNRGLTDRVLTKEEYQHSQSIEFFLRKKIQSVNHYLGSQGVENINQHDQQLSEYQSN